MSNITLGAWDQIPQDVLDAARRLGANVARQAGPDGVMRWILEEPVMDEYGMVVRYQTVRVFDELIAEANPQQ
jgi:hypothetical protein